MFTKFMLLGSAALALSLPVQAATPESQNTSTQFIAVNTVDNQDSIEKRVSFVDETGLASNAQNPIFQTMVAQLQNQNIATVKEALKGGFLRHNEIPSQIHIAGVNYFMNAEQSSHYDADANELRISYIVTGEDTGNVKPLNQFSSLMKTVPSLANADINDTLLNQFVLLHELGHSVNHHHDNGVFSFNDPNTQLNAGEQASLEKLAYETLDENFADTYGAMTFLKINHFSPEALTTLKQIAELRNFLIKQQNPNLLNQPDQIEAHATFYSLNNVLDNLDMIKKTQNIDDLRLLANTYSSNGTALAYQKYRTYHNQSFAADTINQFSELIALDYYNKINRAQSDFKPVEIHWDKVGEHEKEVLQAFVDKQIQEGNQVFAQGFSIKNYKTKDIQNAILDLRVQAGMTDEKIAEYSYVRGQYSLHGAKEKPEYMHDMAQAMIKSDSSLLATIDNLTHIDQKMAHATESTITPPMTQTILAQAHQTSVATNNTPRILPIPNVQAFRESLGVAANSKKLKQ